ncbi:hypothetical protein H6F89_00105, partial [Cyanobacteria bacterium FACHB-63]|nr:hypothetical protein [Cyanobacteria bacterium FACHB-63]
DRQTPQNNDRSFTTIYNIDRLGILNTGDTTIQGDQIGVKSSTPHLDRASPDSPCD